MTKKNRSNSADPSVETKQLGAPLEPSDPPQVGDFWLDSRLTSNEAGVAYLAHNPSHPSVMLLMLSDGAATDAAARDRLSSEVNKLHIDTVIARGGQDQDGGRLAVKFCSEDDDPTGTNNLPLAPWVALLYDGSPAAVAEANRILGHVSLSGVPNLGAVAGPDYRLNWVNNTRPGVWRLWTLPWPGRKDRSGWVPILTSLLLMIVLALLGLLIAILLFQQPDPPPPPEEQGGGGGGGGASSSASASPSTGSGSPTRPPSNSPSMHTLDPTDTKSGGASNEQDERL